MPTRSRNQVVRPDEDGWAVLPEGAQEPHKIFDAKGEAVRHARELARSRGGQVVVLDAGGGLEERIDDRAASEVPALNVHPCGEGWGVFAGTSGEPWFVFSREAHAVDRARTLAVKRSGTLVVHDRGGRVVERTDYGRGLAST